MALIVDRELEAGRLGEEAAEDDAREAGRQADGEPPADHLLEARLFAGGLEGVVDEGLVGSALGGHGEGPEDVIGEQHPVVRGQSEAEDGDGVEELREGQHALPADVVRERAGGRLEEGDEQPEGQVHRQDPLQLQLADVDAVLDPDAAPEEEVGDEPKGIEERDVTRGDGLRIHGFASVRGGRACA